MQFKNAVVLFSLLATSALAAPFHVPHAPHTKRADALTLVDYNTLSISNGTAGDAKAEALAKIAALPDDLSTVSSADLDTIETERESAENAETEAFNPAIDAASGDEATALQNGKIKNKVLKLTLEVAGLEIEQAQGEDNQDKIDEEQTKLDTNIELDEAAAGQASQAVSFDG
ncbi:putative small secreted protein [Phaeomoniella chlamydospora]|uniref:Putative small secreted protein n=1 Tax=Phaeomoniella chlamydospora TaxID=158046 RepID=A0A0G2ECJ6_PHACM|nr:putative small secreted protein [Phaeomoniella chlamydospora]